MLKKVVLTIVFSAIVMSLWAGLRLQFESKNLKNDEPAQTGNMYISDKNITMQVYGEDQESYTIFRGDKELIWAVNDEKKEYTEITKETLAKMGGAINDAMQQMEAQLAQLPEDQRAMFEGMMKQQMGAIKQAAEEEAAFKKTGQKKKINGYPCTKYEVERSGEKVREMWVAQWGSFKNSEETAAAFTAMSEFFKSLMDSMKGNSFLSAIDNPYSYSDKLNGFPVLVTEFDEGKASRETAFKSSEKKKLPAGLFEPPKGYTVNKPDLNQNE